MTLRLCTLHLLRWLQPVLGIPNRDYRLLQKLISIHQIPYSAHRSEIEIDSYIRANRDSWD